MLLFGEIPPNEMKMFFCYFLVFDSIAFFVRYMTRGADFCL